MISFRPAADRLYIAESVVVDIIDIAGRPSKRVRHYRIDGRDRRGYRVDVMKPPLMIWEAIDGGQEVATIAEAKALIKRHTKGVER